MNGCYYLVNYDSMGQVRVGMYRQETPKSNTPRMDKKKGQNPFLAKAQERGKSGENNIS